MILIETRLLDLSKCNWAVLYFSLHNPIPYPIPSWMSVGMLELPL